MLGRVQSDANGGTQLRSGPPAPDREHARNDGEHQRPGRQVEDRSYRDLARDLVSGLPEADQERTLRVIEHISARLDDAMSRATAALEADPPALPEHHARARRARPGF